MAGKTSFWAKKELEILLRTETFTQPATLYVALFDADPLTGGAELPTTGGYARASVLTGDAYWTAPVQVGSDWICYNVPVIDYGTATAGWNGGDPIEHCLLVDTASGAYNAFFAGVLGVSRVVNNTDPVSFAAGTIGIFEPGT